MKKTWQMIRIVIRITILFLIGVFMKTKISPLALALFSVYAVADEPSQSKFQSTSQFEAQPVSQSGFHQRETVELNEIVVNTAREASPLSKLAGNVTVVSEKQLEKQHITSVKEALDNIPNVSFDTDRRFGASDVNIRGISGNRVKVLADGREIANQFSFGPFQGAGRDYVDLSNMKQVEVIKGPTSSLHGSDAIGGVVSLVSKDPEDYLNSGKRGSASLDFDSKDKSIRGGFTYAHGFNDRTSALFTITTEKGSESKSMGKVGGIGSARTKADPQDFKTVNVGAKFSFRINENHRFLFDVGYYQLNHDTDLMSAKLTTTNPPTTPPAPPISITTNYNHYIAEDTNKRFAVGLRHDFTIHQGFADSGYWHLYYQKHSSQQITHRIGSTTRMVGGRPAGAPTSADNFRDSDYQTDNLGLEAQLNKRFQAGITENNLVYGLNYQQKDYEMNRLAIDNGRSASERNAPNSTTHQIGVFAQNRTTFGDSGFHLITGIRYDHYKLKTKPDDVFWASAGRNFALRNYNEGEFSFRLGALYDINEQNAVYFNYAEGFRAPAYNETNLGFTNRQRGYGYVANPNLEAEKSRGFEVGHRYDDGRFNSDFSVFYTKYKNFINTQACVTDCRTANPTSGIIEFTTNNLPKAKIYGAEWAMGLDLDNGLSASASVAYTKGKEQDGTPIHSVSPFSGRVGLNYDAQNWGVGVGVKFAKAKSPKDISQDRRGNPTIPPSAGYAVWDLTGYYQPFKDFTIRAGVHNVFDKEYTTWNDAKGYADPAERTRYGTTGRWFGIGFNYDF